MGRELTKRYGSLFDTKRARIAGAFLRDARKSGKIAELLSFAVWEVCHRLHLFGLLGYRSLRFTHIEPIRLTNQSIESAEFRENLERFFENDRRCLSMTGRQWKSVYIDQDNVMYGRLADDDTCLFRSEDGGDTATLIAKFDDTIKSLFVTRNGTILVSVKGAVYRRSSRVDRFERSLELSTPESFVRHNNGFTEGPNGRILVGEYGNVWTEKGWKALAYWYSSLDEGATWERSGFLIERGANKHVHMIRFSSALNRLLMTDGDNKKRLWITDEMGSTSEEPTWNLKTPFHLRMGGYTSSAEIDGRVLLGTDYQGGTNFIVETSDCRKFRKTVVPDPYRRSPIDNMVVRKSSSGNEVWANLPYSTSTSRCLLMVTRDAGATWTRVFDYSRSDHTVWLLNSSHEGNENAIFAIEDRENGVRRVFRISDLD